MKPISTRKIPFSDPQTWNKHAETYDDAVGRSSSLGIPHLLSLVETFSPSLAASESRAIDLGAGTGSLAFQLAKKYPELPILATDISPGMLDQIMASPLATSQITTLVADMRAPLNTATENLFTHVFSTMAIQALYDPVGEGTLDQWKGLLKKDGLVAIAVWDFDENCGPHALWREAATAVDPTYVNPLLLPEGHWLGLSDLVKGLEAAGFRDIKAGSKPVGFDIGKEAFIRFFWESGNPMPLERKASFSGDLTQVKVEMERLLDEVYDEGRNIPLSVGYAVGRKPAEN